MKVSYTPFFRCKKIRFKWSCSSCRAMFNIGLTSGISHHEPHFQRFLRVKSRSWPRSLLWIQLEEEDSPISISGSSSGLLGVAPEQRAGFLVRCTLWRAKTLRTGAFSLFPLDVKIYLVANSQLFQSFYSQSIVPRRNRRRLRFT